MGKLKMYNEQTDKAIQEFYEQITSEEKSNKKIEECTVVKILDNAFEKKDELTTVLPKGTVLYRAREIETPQVYKDKDCGIDAYYDKNHKFHCNGYDYYNSKEPPIGISFSGRNNIVGMGYLYLSEDKYTSCAEIKPNVRGMISLASFKIEKDLKIFNLYDKVENYWDTNMINTYRVYPNEIMKNIFDLFAKVNKDKKTYLVTQFISDYVRKAGYDGIKYWGSINKGTNYTIFNSHKSNISFINSKIIAVSGVKYSFWDLEKEEILSFESKQSKLNIKEIQQSLVTNFKNTDNEIDDGQTQN